MFFTDFHKRITVLLLFLFLAPALSCEKRDDSEKKKSSPSSEAGDKASGDQTKEGTAQKSPREHRHTLRSLLKEAPRAELRQNGLVINLGTRDAHKYTLGGWRTGWLHPESKEGVNFSPCAAKADMEFYEPWGNISKVTARVRSVVPGQALTLVHRNKAMGKKTIPDKWATVSFALPTTLEKGTHRFSLRFSKRDKKGRAAEVDWIRFHTKPGKSPKSADSESADSKSSDSKSSDSESSGGNDQGSSPPPADNKKPLPEKVANIVLDRPMRSLPAADGRAYIYYMDIPKNSSLVFDYGSKTQTTFNVSLASDDKKEKTVFEKTAKGGKWNSAEINLSEWAGKPARLVFSSDSTESDSTKSDSAKSDSTEKKPADTAKQEHVAGWGEPEIMRKGKRKQTPAISPAKRARNVVYIVIDTARQDVYSPFAPENKVKVPAMQALSKESVWFTDAYANSPWTKPSTATLLSSLYAATHDAVGYRSMLSDEVPILSEQLQKHGFKTGGLVANAFVSKSFGFERGWDHFVNYAREDIPTEAEVLYRDAWKWVEKTAPTGRFFLYMQTMDPHVPYAVPQKYLSMYFDGEYNGKLGDAVTGKDTKDFQAKRITLDERDKLYTKALYKGEITYHDHYMGEFIKKLKKNGLLEDTLFIVSTDHGEELFDREDLGHGHSLYEEQIKSPLVMRYPKLLPKNHRVTSLAELVDLPPTILDLVGVPHIPNTEGTSLWSAIHGDQPSESSYVISELTRHPRTVRLKRKGKAVRVGRYKLHLHQKGASLYDLQKDPKEKVNLSESKKVALRTCKIMLGEGLAIPNKSHRLAGKVMKRKIKAPSGKVDPELKRQLEALAYTN